jgi:hypothetical protein
MVQLLFGLAHLFPLVVQAPLETKPAVWSNPATPCNLVQGAAFA